MPTTLTEIEHFGGATTKLARPIQVTWIQCDAGCPGWLHMEDPHEVQACDMCGRFEVSDPAVELTHDGTAVPGTRMDDNAARAAHALECGCSWGIEQE